MNLQQKMRFSIGTFVLFSGLMGFFVHQYWMFFTMFIGLNLIQFSMTGFCPLEKILKYLESK